MHSPGPTVIFLISSTKCCVLCMWCCDLSTKGLRMPVISLATLYLTESVLERVSLKGCPYVLFGGDHRTW